MDRCNTAAVIEVEHVAATHVSLGLLSHLGEEGKIVKSIIYFVFFIFPKYLSRYGGIPLCEIPSILWIM